MVIPLSAFGLDALQRAYERFPEIGGRGTVDYDLFP
ncbi:DUF5953 family protein [Myxococcus sp. QH3KD-4-1]|nr:DUF5953 family protein [Myxococcus qinghaiensis]